jgi:hypothetical protein
MDARSHRADPNVLHALARESVASPDPHVALERLRGRSRAMRDVHDWRTTLLPAIAEARLPNSCMRVGVALCSRQRGRDWYPWVIVSLDTLAELAGWKPYVDGRTGLEEPNHGCLNRAVRRLEKAGLLVTETLPGVVEGKSRRRATVYRLGPSVGGSKLTPQAGSKLTPQADIVPLRQGVESDPPRTPSGTTSPTGIGERTAALTGGTSPMSRSTSETSSQSRLGDLLSGFRALNRRLTSPNAH